MTVRTPDDPKLQPFAERMTKTVQEGEWIEQGLP